MKLFYCNWELLLHFAIIMHIFIDYLKKLYIIIIIIVVVV